MLQPPPWLENQSRPGGTTSTACSSTGLFHEEDQSACQSSFPPPPPLRELYHDGQVPSQAPDPSLPSSKTSLIASRCRFDLDFNAVLVCFALPLQAKGKVVSGCRVDGRRAVREEQKAAKCTIFCRRRQTDQRSALLQLPRLL